MLVERAAQRKVASRAMGRPAAYLRFEIRVRLVQRPQPEHVPLWRGQYSQMYVKLRDAGGGGDERKCDEPCW